MDAPHEVLCRERERAGISRQELATQAGYHVTTIYRAEMGKSGITPDLLQAYENVLGHSLGLTPTKPSPASKRLSRYPGEETTFYIPRCDDRGKTLLDIPAQPGRRSGGERSKHTYLIEAVTDPTSLLPSGAVLVRAPEPLFGQVLDKRILWQVEAGPARILSTRQYLALASRFREDWDESVLPFLPRLNLDGSRLRPSDHFQQLGAFLKQTRESRNESLRDVARRMGDVGYGSYLSQIERGNNTPRRETLIKIAVGYDVDVSLLLRLVGYIDREEAGL